ncbi:MAG: PTS sugar transporter subunit IIA [Spirochaetales bacterium]|nr:PTS sugar transporter subunit IIA [Spirochaetales bacterium]
MVLSKVFSPALIKVGLEGEDKEEVFEEMVDLFVASNRSVSRTALLQAIRQRESKQSTGVMPGIAFPHAQTDEVSSVSGLIGISRAGVDYDAMDGNPVRIVFMMFSSHDDCSLHLRALKRLSILLSDPEFSRSLLEQKDSNGVYTSLCRYEDLLTTSV